MRHYLQINGQRLIDSLFALGEYGALESGGSAASRPPQRIKLAGILLSPE